MLKSVLTPKNILFAVFVIAITGLAAYLLLLSTGFKFPTQEEKKETTQTAQKEKKPQEIFTHGIITKIDKKNNTFTAYEETAKPTKTFTIKVISATEIILVDKKVSFSSIKLGQITIVSNKIIKEGQEYQVVRLVLSAVPNSLPSGSQK